MRSKQPAKLHIQIQWHHSVDNIEGGGIYKIWFGSKFYIGRTRYLKGRKRSHERDLNRRKIGRWWKPESQFDFYQLVLVHLNKNPQIKVAEVEILEYCKTDDELVAAEQKYFDLHIWDANCLNLGYVATPYKTEPIIRKPKAEKPLNKEKKVSKGKPKKKKQVKKKPKRRGIQQNSKT
jgi:hypothetical protein